MYVIVMATNLFIYFKIEFEMSRKIIATFHEHGNSFCLLSYKHLDQKNVKSLGENQQT